MAREFRILQQIHPVFPAAPAVYRLCEDVSVIGAVFYLMERRTGVILRSPQVSPEEAARLSAAFVDCLAKLHSIYVEIGKPEGFLERQIAGVLAETHGSADGTENRATRQCFGRKHPTARSALIIFLILFLSIFLCFEDD